MIGPTLQCCNLLEGGDTKLRATSNLVGNQASELKTKSRSGGRFLNKWVRGTKRR